MARMTEGSLEDVLRRLRASHGSPREDLAERIEAVLGALPPDESDPRDRILRARLEAYSMGLRKD